MNPVHEQYMQFRAGIAFPARYQDEILKQKQDREGFVPEFKRAPKPRQEGWSKKSKAHWSKRVMK